FVVASRWREKRRTVPRPVPEDPDNDILFRDEAVQPDLTDAQRKRKAFGEARAACDRNNTYHGRKCKLAHLTGHLRAAIPDLSCRDLCLQLCRGLPGAGANTRPSAAVAAVLAAHPDLRARLEAVPRYRSDSNMVDHVGTQLETSFGNMLTLLFDGRLKKSVSPAGAKRQCTYVRRMVCGMDVSWLLQEGGGVPTAAMQAEVALQRGLLGLEEGERVDDDWLEDPANRGRLLRHAVHTTREMEAAMAAWQQSELTNPGLLPRPPRLPTPYAITPTSKRQARHVFIGTKGLYGLMRDAGMLAQRCQYYRESGITRQAQAIKTWLAQVKPQLKALSQVSSKPSSLASYRQFADTVLATYDVMWAEVSKPRWANAKSRLYCGKKRVVARSKGVPVSQMMKEAVRQFAAGRVLMVDEFLTSRVSSAYSNPSEAPPGEPPESSAPRDALGGSDAETMKKALAGAGAASSSSDGGPAGAGAAALGASPVGVGAGAGPTAAMECQAPGTSEGARVAAPASDPTAPSAPGVALSGAAADPAAVGTGSEASTGPFSADNPQRKFSTTTAFTTTSRRHPSLLPLASAVPGLGGWRLGGRQGGGRQLHVSAARGAEGEAGPYSVPPMTPGAPGCGVTGPAAAGAARTEAGPASGYGGASGAGGTPGASEERGEAQGGSQPTAAKSATPAEVRSLPPGPAATAGLGVGDDGDGWAAAAGWCWSSSS
ncbi:hypothetical protein QJQ45_016678, partial [Haematococcus lacustris]